MEDVEAEGKDPQLYQPVVSLRLLRRPPTDDAQGYVEDGGQTLREISLSVGFPCSIMDGNDICYKFRLTVI